MRVFLKCFMILSLVIAPFTSFFQNSSVKAATSSINLSFTPNDSAVDPNKPVIYMTKLGSKTLYAANYETGEIKTLNLPLPAERLDLKNNRLYVTQLKMSHTPYGSDFIGAIAEVDTDSFTVIDTMDINTDPYDIAVDDQGYIYISPGSGQWGNLKVYSIKDKTEKNQSSGATSIYERTNIAYNTETSKIYATTTALSPRNIEAYKIENGIIKNHYYSPYHGDYTLGVTGKFSPDGMSLYNNGGFVFDLATDVSGVMTYSYSFGKAYNDFAFSPDNKLTFAASTTSGIDVYQYGTNTFLYSLRKDLNVQTLHYKDGWLIAINKDSSGANTIATIAADSQPSNGLPATPGVPDPAGTINNLGFKPNDLAIDPDKPVIYATRLGSKTIYSINFSTGEIKGLALPYPAERLELYNHKLYVTQHKMAHEYYTKAPLTGAIAEVDTSNFTATKLIDIDTDPYDIAIDENGFAYIAPGSNQWEAMKVYSLATGGEIPNTYVNNIRFKSYLYYNPETSKVYSISTDSSPRDVDAYEVDKGVIKAHYDSPYHGDYPLESFAKITPDGATMINNSGVAFDLAMFKSGDMTYSYTFGRTYNDYAFSIEDKLTFAARKDSGIDVYQFNTNKYLYTIKKDLKLNSLFYQNGKIVASGMDSSGRNNVTAIDAATSGVLDPPTTTPSNPGTSNPDAPATLELLESVYVDWSGDDIKTYSFTNGVQNVPLSSFFDFRFNQFIDLDETKIQLTGPEGNVELYCGAEEDEIYIIPEALKGLTTYTLTIKRGAISGELGQNLAKDISIQFKTASNWEEKNGKWYYYDSATGKYATGWKVISESKYYFNVEGVMQTGFQTIDGSKYYFNNKGVMETGWQTIEKNKYYISEKGIVQTDWQTIQGKKYYFDNLGAMITGWKTIDGNNYYFDTQGVMETGWIMVNGIKYYLNENGNLLTGWATISGKNYYFNEVGMLQVGFQNVYGRIYYFNENGEMVTANWQKVDGKLYYFDGTGSMLTGWLDQGGKMYYLSLNTGAALIGWQSFSSGKYYFDEAGAMQTGWKSISGKRYYFSTSGAMLTSWQSISGKKYYFNPSGAMLTGWQNISGKKYYFNPSGAMLTGWQSISGKKYYFNPSGAMLTGWQSISGKKYYFNPSGAMLIGWQSISGKKYYFNTSGAMLIGWQKISGKKYYFDATGVMLTGKKKINGKWYSFDSKGVLK